MSDFQLGTKTLQDIVLSFSTLTQTIKNGPSLIWSIFAPINVPSSATTTLDLSKGFNFSINPLSINTTLANPTNVKAGQSGSLYIKQDGTGSRTIAFGTAWKFAGGSPPTLSTAANALDELRFKAMAPNFIVANLVKGIA